MRIGWNHAQLDQLVKRILERKDLWHTHTYLSTLNNSGHTCVLTSDLPTWGILHEALFTTAPIKIS